MSYHALVYVRTKWPDKVILKVRAAGRGSVDIRQLETVVAEELHFRRLFLAMNSSIAIPKL